MTRGFGRLGLQLTLAFVTVAVAAVAGALTITGLAVSGYEHQIRTHQQAQETAAIAVSAAAAYDVGRSQWSKMLVPVVAAANRLGAAAQVRDNAGRVVRTSPRFGHLPPGAAFQAPVTVNGHRVGSVALRFGSGGLAQLLAQFNTERWRARIMGGLAGALLGLAAAVVLASRIIDPLDRLLRTARARAAGHPDARVGQVRGFRDIRQLAESFDRMADVLKQQDQLRRNLVADLAHELRTPVAVMQAQAEAMLDGITTTSPTEIESLHEEMLRLARMIDDLQQLSEAEAAATQLAVVPCDLADQAAVAAGSLGGTFDSAGVALELRLSNAPARCDKVRMQDVIRNLLMNAAKYTPAGGTVVVETKPADKQAVLRVADTGIGIAADDLPHVMERFYRGSRSDGISGTGIGLAVVEELVRAQHGALRIASEPGQGTEVTILLPRARHADNPTAVPDRVARSTPRSSALCSNRSARAGRSGAMRVQTRRPTVLSRLQPQRWWPQC